MSVRTSGRGRGTFHERIESERGRGGQFDLSASHRPHLDDRGETRISFACLPRERAFRSTLLHSSYPACLSVSHQYCPCPLSFSKNHFRVEIRGQKRLERGGRSGGFYQRASNPAYVIQSSKGTKVLFWTWKTFDSKVACCVNSAKDVFTQL